MPLCIPINHQFWAILGVAPSEKPVWRPLEQEHATLVEQVNEAAVRVRKCISVVASTHREGKDAIRWQEPEETASLPMFPVSDAPEDVAKLPCIMYPPRIHRFFDRVDVVAKIGEYLGQCGANADDGLRSVALHGLAGVGKSSIALRYTELLLQKGALDAMFWVHGEKAVTMSQSFTDIALRLKLPDASLTDHDNNRVLVLDWLQRTSETHACITSQTLELTNDTQSNRMSLVNCI